MKVVSFLPSATEMLFAMGAGDLLVARSHECDHPPEVRRLPVASRSRVRAGQAPGAIHEGVWRTFAQGRSHFEIDVGLLERVGPDLVICQDTCSVCALTNDQVERTVATLPDPPRVLTLSAHRLSDVLTEIEEVGRAVDRPEAARELVRHLRERWDAVKRMRPPRDQWPRALYLEWFDPLMAGGGWSPEQLESAGALDIFGAPGGSSTHLTWEEIRSGAPDAVVLGPCGFDLNRAREDLPEITGAPGWAVLPAVRARRAWLVDGKAFMSRSGPRLFDGIEVLARLFHPDVYGPAPGEPEALPVAPGG